MRHSGHIRARSKGSFELRYSRGNDPITGKWTVETQTVKGTRKDAEKRLREILDALDMGTHVEPSTIKVREFLTQWLDTIRSQVSPKTYERYDQIINGNLIPTFGNQLLIKLAPLAIQQAYNNWEKTGRRDGKDGGLAPRSRLHIHRVLKSALNYAVQLQLIHRNPVSVVKAPRVKRTAITILTIEQSATLLDSIRGKNIYWPVLLALATGMRRGEVLALRWRNLDLDNRTVRIVESLEQTKQGVRFKSPKTGKTRAVVLPSYAVEEFRALRDAQHRELAALGVRQTQNTMVCARYDGEPLWPSSLTHEFAKAIRRVKDLPIVRFHDLRHSHATQLLSAGIHPKIAQERLGHSSITTTLDLYSHVSETMQDEAAMKLDSAIRTALRRLPMPFPKPT